MPNESFLYVLSMHSVMDCLDRVLHADVLSFPGFTEVIGITSLISQALKWSPPCRLTCSPGGSRSGQPYSPCLASRRQQQGQEAVLLGRGMTSEAKKTNLRLQSLRTQ